MSKPYDYGLANIRPIWRELAIEHLPDLREVIVAATSHVDLWQLLKERLLDVGTSVSRSAEAQSIYDYAWWCVAKSNNDDLAAEIGAYFFEDLPVYSGFVKQMPLFIAPSQFEALEKYFHYRPADEEYAIFRSRFFANCGNKNG